MTLSEIEQIIYGFGNSTNLYKDVLNIDQHADSSEILRAYHIQWRNIRSGMKFATTEYDREVEKKKIEALHSTYKILSNSCLRNQYNDFFPKVGQGKLDSPMDPIYNLWDFDIKLKSSKAYKSNKVFRRAKDEFSPKIVLGVIEATNARIEYERNHDFEINNDSIELSYIDDSFDQSTESYEDEPLDITLEILEKDLPSTHALIRYNPILRCVPISHKKKIGTMMKDIYEEVEETKEDTLSAFEQVWNVFSIQPEELDSLVGVINKEKQTFYKIDEFYETVKERLPAEKTRFEF